MPISSIIIVTALVIVLGALLFARQVLAGAGDAFGLLSRISLLLLMCMGRVGIVVFLILFLLVGSGIVLAIFGY